MMQYEKLLFNNDFEKYVMYTNRLCLKNIKPKLSAFIYGKENYNKLKTLWTVCKIVTRNFPVNLKD